MYGNNLQFKKKLIQPLCYFYCVRTESDYFSKLIKIAASIIYILKNKS